MNKLRIPFLLLLGCLLAGAAGAESYFDPQTMLDVNQVKRGDKAVGKTVFTGIAITEFHLEIIDIMRQANLGEDMILARLLDGPVVTRQVGIIGGMSGSPVYIDGKLIGAIAWGWPFQKEPVAGITPIRTMLQTLDLMSDKQAQVAPQNPSWTASRPIELQGQTYTAAAVVAQGQRVAAHVLPLRPVATPINCSGFGPNTLKLVAEKLGPRGLQPMAGSGGTAECVPVELEPGAAVGVRFMEGDFDMTGIGTVTWRKDDKILAFGHPLMQLGRVNMPMTTAWINEFIAAYDRTDKMGCGMAGIGSMRADTAWAIGGQIGPTAPTIPARFEITDHSRNYSRTFNVKVFDQPSLTPIVLMIGISQALESVYNPGYEGVIRTHFEIKGKHGATLKRDNQFYMQGSPVDVGVEEVVGMMQLLEENRWQPQGIAELVYKAELTDRDETALIEKVYIEENVARAGKPLHVHALLRPDGGPLQDHVLTVNMPVDLPKGTIRIGIGSGGDTIYFRSRFGIMLPGFESLPEVVEFVDKMEENKQLCLVVALPDNGVLVGSTRLMDVPSSIVSVLEKSTRTDMDQGKEELYAGLDPGYVVLGRHMVSLATEDRMGARGTVTADKTKPAANGKSNGSSKSNEDDMATGLWWAESALKPLVARRLRAEAAAAGRPWPTAAEAADLKKDDKAKDKADEAKAADKDDEEDDLPEDAEEEDAGAKPLVRQPSAWLQDEAEDFAKGEVKGITLRSDGGLCLAPGLSNLGRLAEGYIWGAASHGDNTYLGTGMPGRVYRVAKGGKPELWCDPGVFAIRGMAVDGKGELYIGTWPGGKVFRVGADGKASLFCALPCDYVWALAFDKAGRLLAGTGPTGKLFAIDAAGKAEQVLQLPQAHLLSLLVRDDTLYMGSGTTGVIYELGPDQKLRALTSTEDDVTALAAAGDNVLYAATAGSEGQIYRLELPGTSENTRPDTYLAAEDLPIYALLAVGKVLYAATGAEGKLLAVTGEDRYEVVHDSDTTHLLCLAPTATGFLIGTGNSAETMSVDCAAATEGTYLSSVFDASRQARWAAIDWQATVPEGAEMTIQTRSGQSADPDDGGWSVWSIPYAHPRQQSITSPPARYLQYRVQMKSSKQTPELRWLSLGYLPANQKPTVKFDDLSADKPWKGEVEIEWTGDDPDDDDLVTTLEYRPVGDEAWQTVKQLGADDTTYAWKTSAVKDGRYDVRLTVSDEPANPGAGLSGEKILYAVQIDNSAPSLLVQKAEAKDGILSIEGIASDEVRLAEVAYQVNEQWRGAVPLDGLFDGQFEQFRFTVPLDKDGKASLTIRCRDTAGNVGTQEFTWPQEPEKKEG